MEIFKIASVTIALILATCFILFLVWMSIMVFILKGVRNDKIEALGHFFSKLPLKKFFNLFYNNNLTKDEK